ncbi:hypothetical protein [Halobacterium litoreum]|uniref:Uncharacterized protein n=1 Tax=Halobacterium litoreum TaxID=2039234 RepID=A0ABD5NI16_9EURY|nr:hypothetical protein [Halobacterium litoreum]UHH12421.1 hypothetical protein LT972_09650 [Halobacterium litoreum]
MATSDVLSLHTKGGFDMQDVLGAPFFGLAAVVLTGIGSFTILGVSFNETLFSGSGASISIALVTAALLLVLSWATNRAGDGWDDLDEVESVAVGGGTVLLLGMAFMPFIQDLVLGSDIVGLVAFVLLSSAYTVVSWY